MLSNHATVTAILLDIAWPEYFIRSHPHVSSYLELCLFKKFHGSFNWFWPELGTLFLPYYFRGDLYVYIMSAAVLNANIGDAIVVHHGMTWPLPPSGWPWRRRHTTSCLVRCRRQFLHAYRLMHFQSEIQVYSFIFCFQTQVFGCPDYKSVRVLEGNVYLLLSAATWLPMDTTTTILWRSSCSYQVNHTWEIYTSYF